MVQRGQSPNPFHCEGGKNPLSTMDVFEFLMALFGSLYLYARYIYFAYFHILLQLQFGFSPKNMNEVNTPNYRRLSMLRSNVHVFDESFVKLIELPAAQIRVASLFYVWPKTETMHNSTVDVAMVVFMCKIVVLAFDCTVLWCVASAAA